jgi:DNA-binding transcriptional MerR regulator
MAHEFKFMTSSAVNELPHSDVVWIEDASGEPMMTDDKTEYTIGELSREFGITLRALRFYENRGLIAPRREGLTRFYSRSDRDRIALILKGKKLGFTLSEIGQMIAAEEGEGDAHALRLSREKCLEQINLLEKQKRDIEEALAELRRTYTSLSSKLVGLNSQAG